jgi:hypothetical protein
MRGIPRFTTVVVLPNVIGTVYNKSSSSPTPADPDVCLLCKLFDLELRDSGIVKLRFSETSRSAISLIRRGRALLERHSEESNKTASPAETIRREERESN